MWLYRHIWWWWWWWLLCDVKFARIFRRVLNSDVLSCSFQSLDFILSYISPVLLCFTGNAQCVIKLQPAQHWNEAHASSPFSSHPPYFIQSLPTAGVRQRASHLSHAQMENICSGIYFQLFRFTFILCPSFQHTVHECVNMRNGHSWHSFIHFPVEIISFFKLLIHVAQYLKRSRLYLDCK